MTLSVLETIGKLIRLLLKNPPAIFLKFNRPTFYIFLTDISEESYVRRVEMAEAKKKKLGPLMPSGKRMIANRVYPAWQKNKKKAIWVVRGNKSKLIAFGDSRYKNNHSAAARKSYLARSAGIKNKSGKNTANDIWSANYYARKYLW